MPFVAVPQVAKMTIESHTVGVSMYNVFHVIGDSAFTLADCQDLSDYALAQWQTRIGFYISQNVEIESCQVTALDSSSAPTWTHVNAVPGANNAGHDLPLNVCMCVSLHVPTRYRGGHGRSYLSGLVGGDLANTHTWDGAVAAGVQTAFQNWVNDINGHATPDNSPIELCIVHYTRGGVALLPPEPEVITGVTVDTAVCTQRRRLK